MSLQAQYRTPVLMIAITFALGTLSSPCGAWEVTVSSAPFTDDRPNAVAVDSSGAVVAAGFLDTDGGTRGDFAVVRFSGIDGRELWRQQIDGAGDREEAEAVVIDGAGDVLVAGSLGDRFTVIKLSGATGEELWRTQLDGDDATARGVAVDAAGDVVAAGYLQAGQRHFTVVKLSEVGGAVLWQREIADGFATSVAVDGSGDVVAAGSLNNLAAGSDLFVAKFAGTGGVELWRARFAGPHPSDSGAALSVKVDGAGAVFAAGAVGSTEPGGRFAVVKYSGQGVRQWVFTVDRPNSLARDLALDASGNAVAAGQLGNDFGGHDFAVIKLAGSTGADQWTATTHGTAPSEFSDGALAVAVGPAGDVVAVGQLHNLDTDQAFAVIKLSATNGQELWRRELQGMDPFLQDEDGVTGTAVALDGSGDTIAAGVLQNDPTFRDFAVVKLSGIDGNAPTSELIQQTIDTLNGIPRTAFRNPGNQAALRNKLREVQSFISSESGCDLCQALSKLVHDILPKTDGETPPPDWITDAELQAPIRALIERLQREVNAQGGCGDC